MGIKAFFVDRLWILVLLGYGLFPTPAFASTATTFTYQGRLSDSGLPAEGFHDFQVTLHSAAMEGSQIGPVLIVSAVDVEKGVFTVDLDFGGGAFGADVRWIELAVRKAGGPTFTTLTPRQAVRAVPVAQYAMTPAGPAGPQGVKGDKGDPGVAGPQGLQGETGSTGVAGPAGPQGAKGDKGDPGVAGPQGLQGETGLTGAAGAAGPQGAKGDKGDPGVAGPRGLQGETGLTGAAGPTGPQGPRGNTGPQGPKGDKGDPGPEGPPGSANAWGLLGNAGTDPAKNFIGTTDRISLQLRVDNQPAIHILPDQRIGFGTTTIAENASAHFELPSSVSMPHVRISEPRTDAGFGIQFVNPGSTWLMGPNLGNVSDQRFGIFSEGSQRGLSIAANGNIQVGFISAVTAPTALAVDGSISFSSVATPAMYVYQNGTANPERPLIMHSPAFPSYGLYYRDEGDRFVMKSSSTDTTPSLVVDLDSNWVAIASETPKPGYELSVNGQIVCEDILIQDSSLWPDYVFQPDYALKPLEEVESHIREHKHLPGIPSAETIEKEGIRLADMQKRMMEKIEELVLYAIDQNKRIAVQDQKIAELSATIRQLKRQQSNAP